MSRWKWPFHVCHVSLGPPTSTYPTQHDIIKIWLLMKWACLFLQKAQFKFYSKFYIECEIESDSLGQKYKECFNKSLTLMFEIETALVCIKFYEIHCLWLRDLFIFGERKLLGDTANISTSSMAQVSFLLLLLTAMLECVAHERPEALAEEQTWLQQSGIPNI